MQSLNPAVRMRARGNNNWPLAIWYLLYVYLFASGTSSKDERKRSARGRRNERRRNVNGRRNERERSRRREISGRGRKQSGRKKRKRESKLLPTCTVVSRVSTHSRVSAHPPFLLILWFTCIYVMCTNDFYV